MKIRQEWLQLTRHFSLLICACVLTACISGPPGAGIRWVNYPDLHPVPSTSYKWLVVECQFNDQPNVPAGLDTDIRQFLGLAGAGYGNIVDYFHDVSYNATSVFAGAVVDWVPAPFSLGDVTNPRGRLAGNGKRKNRVIECLQAVPANLLPDLSAYYGVIAVSNVLSDGGACFDGQSTLNVNGTDYTLGCIWFDPNSLFTAFASHEIAHGLGQKHSFDDAKRSCGSSIPGEYCDPWDIMSALATYQFEDKNWLIGGASSKAGPGMTAANLVSLGWLPTSTVENFQFPDDGSDQTFALSPLSRALTGGKLAIAINIANTPADGIYVVEYRQGDGWDFGFKSDGNAPSAVRFQGGVVLVHRLNLGQPALVTLIDSDAVTTVGGRLLTDRVVLTNGVTTVHVNVDSIDTTKGIATVSIGPGR